MSARSLAVVVSVLALAACSGAPRRGGTDGGTDSGPGFDAGPGLDLGSHDSGSGTDLGGPRDLGGGTDSGGGTACDSPIPYVDTATCSAAVSTCLRGCTDVTCDNGCYAMDTTGTCQLCIIQNQIACAEEGGCTSQWNAYSCCIETMCPMGSAMTCGSTMCGSQLTAFRSCETTYFGTMPACRSHEANCLM